MAPWRTDERAGRRGGGMVDGTDKEQKVGVEKEQEKLEDITACNEATQRRRGYGRRHHVPFPRTDIFQNTMSVTLLFFCLSNERIR